MRKAARAHDENFPVAFMLAPPQMRPDLHAVYVFCRTTDDLGDEAAGDRLALLDEWERDVRRAFGGRPHDPRLLALAATVSRRGLDLDPFLRLIEANRMDQRQARWQTYEALLHYCRHSATPVGEMVLGVLGYHDPQRVALSDATCIGLQLVNFWQDVRRDLRDRGRVYLPTADMEAYGVPESDLWRERASFELRQLVAFEVGRARAELERGACLADTVPRREGIVLRMFTAGGVGVCDAIARQDYDTLVHRPAPGARGRARIGARVLASSVGGGR